MTTNVLTVRSATPGNIFVLVKNICHHGSIFWRDQWSWLTQFTNNLRIYRFSRSGGTRSRIPVPGGSIQNFHKVSNVRSRFWTTDFVLCENGMRALDQLQVSCHDMIISINDCHLTGHVRETSILILNLKFEFRIIPNYFWFSRRRFSSRGNKTLCVTTHLHLLFLATKPFSIVILQS